MRSVLLASCLIPVASLAAQASVFSFDLTNGLAVEIDTVLPGKTYAPFVTRGLGVIEDQHGDIHGPQGELLARSPFGGGSDKAYDAVLPGGSATSITPLPPIEPGDPTFGYGAGSFSFVWGSPDPDNSVRFLGTPFDVTGQDLGPSAPLLGAVVAVAGGIAGLRRRGRRVAPPGP